ncbi:lipopolysaccharide biosynthesis protein [Thiolapillus sp.]
MSMLKQQTKSAVLWSGMDLLVRQGLGFVISVILARLLGPDDFGTIALLSLFMGIAWVLVNVGFSSALIQKQDITHADESTVFWFNMVLGFFLAAAIAALAPWLARIYEKPVLFPLTMAMALNVMFSAACSVHSALLAKRLDFRNLMYVGLLSTVVSGGIGVYLAWSGFGVWALAIQSLTANLVSMLLFWLLASWMPAWTFSMESFRRLAGFGGYLLASRLLNMTFRKGYTLLLGKFFGLTELGYYTRAERIQALPTALVTGIAAKVALPLFASSHMEAERRTAGARMAIRVMMLITVPLVFGLSALAYPVTGVILGEAWMPVAPILQVLCLAGLLWPMDVINANLLKALGHARLFFRLEVAKLVAGVILLVAGSFYGVMGIAWAFVLQSIIGFVLNGYYVGCYTGYGGMGQLRDCLPAFLLGGGMMIIVSWINSAMKVDNVLDLVLVIGLGALVYLVGNLVFAVSAFRDALDLLNMRGST